MKLLAVEIGDFRNLAAVRLEPHPAFNVVAGDNGQGKTNLLEALYLLCTLTSFRAARLDELVRFGSEGSRVRARVERHDLERLYEVEISLRPLRKNALVDGKPVRASHDYFGGMNTVLFTPDDLQLPRGAPSARRRFLDRAVWNSEPRFLAEARDYLRLQKSRNAVLRDGDGPRTAELLEVYDQQLAEAGAVVVRRRRRYLTALAPRVEVAFHRITDSSLAVVARYESSLVGDDAGLADELHAQLVENHRRDLLRGYTSRGPHADDLGLLLDGRDVRLHASQGQLRALMLALKIAEIEHLSSVLDEPPLLLLDDVSSELDATRNRHLFDFLAEVNCQTFITTTAPGHVLLKLQRRDFRMVAGGLQKNE